MKSEIDDIYSGSASGTRHFTLHVLLGDVILIQPDAYGADRLQAGVSRDRRGRAMTDYPIFNGELEIRARRGGRSLRGRFPYNRTATIRSAGRVRKERFLPGSMSWQVRQFEKIDAEYQAALKAGVEDEVLAKLADDRARRDTFLLVGHSYDRAIASSGAGTLAVRHTGAAVEIEADLPPEDRQASWVRDAVLAIEAGQLRGISPGFQVGPKGGERLVREDPADGDAMIREITDAVVFEYSLVARPAYPQTQVDARAMAELEPRQGRRTPRWL